MASTVSSVLERNRGEERRERRALTKQGMAPRVNVGSSERVVSTLAGGLLAAWGLRRRGTTGYGAALIGAELLYRGVSGHCAAYSALGISTDGEIRRRGEPASLDHERAIDVRHGIVVQRPRDELFAMWRDFSRLPDFMEQLDRVEVLSPTVSHWVTKGPAGVRVEWDAEIVDERDGEWIAWRAIEPAEVPNNGTVMFRELPGGATEVFVTLEAQPPAGRVGELVARMFGRSPQQQVKRALQRFKEVAEREQGFSGASSSQGKFTDRPVSESTSRSVGADHTATRETGWSVPIHRSDDVTRQEAE